MYLCENEIKKQQKVYLLIQNAKCTSVYVHRESKKMKKRRTKEGSIVKS